jgi:hypothetical protein
MPAKRRGRIPRRVDKLGAILCAKDEMEKNGLGTKRKRVSISAFAGLFEWVRRFDLSFLTPDRGDLIAVGNVEVRLLHQC